MTLNVGVKDLHSWLDKAAPGEVLILLYQGEPRLQQLVICLHINHVVFVQLKETEDITELWVRVRCTETSFKFHNQLNNNKKKNWYSKRKLTYKEHEG